jgi:hypothetical protein
MRKLHHGAEEGSAPTLRCVVELGRCAALLDNSRPGRSLGSVGSIAPNRLPGRTQPKGRLRGPHMRDRTGYTTGDHFRHLEGHLDTRMACVSLSVLRFEWARPATGADGEGALLSLALEIDFSRLGRARLRLAYIVSTSCLVMSLQPAWTLLPVDGRQRPRIDRQLAHARR